MIGARDRDDGSARPEGGGSLHDEAGTLQRVRAARQDHAGLWDAPAQEPGAPSAWREGKMTWIGWMATNFGSVAAESREVAAHSRSMAAGSR